MLWEQRRHNTGKKSPPITQGEEQIFLLKAVAAHVLHTVVPLAPPLGIPFYRQHKVRHQRLAARLGCSQRPPLFPEIFTGRAGEGGSHQAFQSTFTCQGLHVTPNVQNVHEAPWGISPCSGLQPTVYGRAEEGSQAGLPSHYACKKSCFVPPRSRAGTLPSRASQAKLFPSLPRHPLGTAGERQTNRGVPFGMGRGRVARGAWEGAKHRPCLPDCSGR